MTDLTIAIVDYDMGNVGSVANALRRLDIASVVTREPSLLAAADAYILPGVGAFPAAMANLSRFGLIPVLEEQVVQRTKPLLGICLGMQLIAESSVEQRHCEGLGWIEGQVVALKGDPTLRVPHVGWNDVAATDDPLFADLGGGSHFYFDHSFELHCPESLVSATCDYGGRRVAAVRKGRIFATQFHPEKSQRNGLRLLRNFEREVLSTKARRAC